MIGSNLFCKLWRLPVVEEEGKKISFTSTEEPSTALQELGMLIELLTRYELVAESHIQLLIDGVISALYEPAWKAVVEEPGDEVDAYGLPVVSYTPKQIFDNLITEEEAAFIADLRNSISITIFDVINPNPTPVNATILLRWVCWKMQRLMK